MSRDRCDEDARRQRAGQKFQHALRHGGNAVRKEIIPREASRFSRDDRGLGFTHRLDHGAMQTRNVGFRNHPGWGRRKIGSEIRRREDVAAARVARQRSQALPPCG